MRSMKQTIALLLALVLLTTSAALAAQTFADVADGAWYAEAVDFVCEKGWMQGTGEGRFSPDAALTRAQLITILWRAAGAPAVGTAAGYSDVKADAWYAAAVRWAAVPE